MWNVYIHATKLKKQDTCFQLLYLWFVKFSTVVIQLITIVLINFRSINKDQFEKKKNDTLDPELWVVIS